LPFPHLFGLKEEKELYVIKSPIMKRFQFKATIDASPERVWEVLWGDETYPAWTAPFAEGSQVKTDWQKGSKVLFLDGKGQGMVSFIDEKIPNEFMSFRHMGMVSNGVEEMDTEKTKGWAGALENYTLRPANGGTDLTIDIDITEDHQEYFNNTWPKALEKLKEISEKEAVS
jgi:uncharacterized protein YndB with AHSA1/START domain